MPEENNGQPQVGGQSEPQVGANNNPQVGEQNQSALSLEQALDALHKARQEAASNRVKVNEYEEKARKEAEAQMTEVQKFQSKAADLERELAEKTRVHQERAIQYEVRLHAAKKGIIDPDAAAKLLDLSQLEYDADGNPTNAGKLLDQLAKDKPYLVGVAPSGSVTNPPTRQTNPTTFSSAQINAMSPEDYQKNKAAIMVAYKEGRITP